MKRTFDVMSAESKGVEQRMCKAQTRPCQQTSGMQAAIAQVPPYVIFPEEEKRLFGQSRLVDDSLT